MSHDVLIAGGGVIGCSIAYHLAAYAPELEIAVIERDPAYSRASTGLSVGNVRIQFSLAENIKISQYASEVFERFEEEMEVDGVRPDIRFLREGNLFLVAEDQLTEARAAFELQRSLGCEVQWLEKNEISDRYPILNTEGLAGATFGKADGHLDGHALLGGYRLKAQSIGVEFLVDDVTRIVVESGRVAGLQLRSGARLEGPKVVNCAGAWAGNLARSAGVELPLQPIKRQAFFVETPRIFDDPLPLIVLPSGLYFRSEAPGLLLVGRSLPEDETGFSFSWQESRFNDVLWPDLAEWASCFDRLRLVRGWAGLYAVNTLDGNAVLGEWPEVEGLFLANAFSGHGLQQAPAIGRFLAESILEREPSVDLSLLGPRRVLENRALGERGLV